MRISTPQFYTASLAGMLNQQATIGNLSQQLSTGNRLTNPADYPVDSAQVVGLAGQLNRLASYQQNGQNAQNSLQLESSTLQSAGTLLNQVRSLALQMNNATVSSQDLNNAASAMSGYLQQLLQYANTQDGQGNYLFAGSKNQTQPFSLLPNGQVQYSGDGAQNQLTIGSSLQTAVSDPGNAIFMDIPAGNGSFTVAASGANTGGAVAGPGSVANAPLAQQVLVVDQTQYQISFSGSAASGGTQTYTVTSGTGSAMSASGVVASGTFTPGMSITVPSSGGGAVLNVPVQGTPASGDTFTIAAAGHQSLFTTFQKLQQAFSMNASAPGTNAQRALAIGNAIAGLDQAQTTLLNTQAAIGTRLQQVQAVQNMNSTLTLQLQTQQSQLTDINYPQVITAYQQSLTALQASEAAYAKVQGLSLFQYI